MAIFAVKLTNAIGAQGPAIMIIYLVISGFFLTLLRKPVAQMVNTIIHFLIKYSLCRLDFVSKQKIHNR